MSRSQARQQPTPQTVYLAQVVGTVIDFVLRCGLPPQQLQDLVQARLRQGAAAAQKSSGQSIYLVMPNVLLHWHTELNLLDADGSPKPLRLYGPAPSVEALVQAEQPRDTVRQIIASMQETGMLRRTAKGRYLPTTSAATVSQLNPFLVEHVTTSLIRFLETVQTNVTTGNEEGALLERCAQVINLPVSELPAFRGFVRDYGADFLNSVDTWLSSRSIERRGRKATPVMGVGVHVFAHVQLEGKKSARTRVANR